MLFKSEVASFPPPRVAGEPTNNSPFRRVENHNSICIICVAEVAERSKSRLSSANREAMTVYGVVVAGSELLQNHCALMGDSASAFIRQAGSIFRSMHRTSERRDARKIKWPFRRGQPVGFPVVAWAFVLEVKVERTIGVGLEWHVAAHRKTIEREHVPTPR